MARLIWNATGERFYELGVDRGVLYVPGLDGVPWTGLTAVRETPSGGNVTPYYVDGIRYLNVVATEDFEGSIESFGIPEEFNRCIGVNTLVNGLFATHQNRSEFGMSYRTIVGNDVDGEAHGYKIHLVYNAVVSSPSNRDNQTLSNQASPIKLSHGFTTVPRIIPGVKPTAHLILDTRYLSSAQLKDVEDVLYGSELLTASLPSPSELVALLS